VIGRQVICSRCRREATCRAVLEVQHAPRRVFCDAACMTIFVREQYIECGRATATPAEPPGPPSGTSSAGIGAAREPLASGKSSVAPVRRFRWADFLRSVRP
jgi:hypothetical protein